VGLIKIMNEKLVYFKQKIRRAWIDRLNKIKLGLNSRKTKRILRSVAYLLFGISVFYLFRTVKVAYAVDFNNGFPKAKVKRSWKVFFEDCKKHFIPTSYNSKLIFLGSIISLTTVLGLHQYLSGIESANEEKMIAIIEAAMERYFETQKE
jgi:hypothetical protein